MKVVTATSGSTAEAQAKPLQATVFVTTQGPLLRVKGERLPAALCSFEADADVDMRQDLVLGLVVGDGAAERIDVGQVNAVPHGCLGAAEPLACADDLDTAEASDEDGDVAVAVDGHLRRHRRGSNQFDRWLYVRLVKQSAGPTPSIAKPLNASTLSSFALSW
ncbi:hypothetical protein [Micromonospora musae]|uniref:hypothetical protein n=1 Tax=Micromonospora musae TaxID=1894970 RepID=UPI0013158706